MKVAFKDNLSLTKAKTLIRTVLTEGGKLVRVDGGCARLETYRGHSYTLCFKSNLELRGLI